MSDITRWTSSDVAKTTTKSDVSKNTSKSDVKGDATKIVKLTPTFSMLARRMLRPKLTTLSQKNKFTLNVWRGHLGSKSGGSSTGFPPGGPGDRLAKTVQALRAAVRFKGQWDLDPQLAAAHQLDPRPECRFQADRVKKLLEVILETRLEGFIYDGATATTTLLSLSQQITDEVKAFEFPRYKLVSNVIMGQVQGQDLQISSRCLWNSYSDSFACATHQTATYFVMALVHATYYE